MLGFVWRRLLFVLVFLFLFLFFSSLDKLHEPRASSFANCYSPVYASERGISKGDHKVDFSHKNFLRSGMQDNRAKYLLPLGGRNIPLPVPTRYQRSLYSHNFSLSVCPSVRPFVRPTVLARVSGRPGSSLHERCAGSFSSIRKSRLPTTFGL